MVLHHNNPSFSLLVSSVGRYWLIQGGFFNWSARFSVPKWKTSCSQPGLVFQEIFNVKKLLVGWASFVHFGTENRADQLKKTPCIIPPLYFVPKLGIGRCLLPTLGVPPLIYRATLNANHHHHPPTHIFARKIWYIIYLATYFSLTGPLFLCSGCARYIARTIDTRKKWNIKSRE